MPKHHVDITLDPRIINMMKDRGINNRSKFIAQAVEAYILNDEEMSAYMMASKVKECFDEGNRVLKELEKVHKTRDFQSILERWGVRIKSDEQNALKNLYDALMMPTPDPKNRRHPEDLGDASKIPGILSWIDARAPGFGLNYPPNVILDKLKANGFSEGAKA